MKLIRPDEAYFDSYRTAIEEYCVNEVTTYAFLDMPVQELLKYVDDIETGNNLPDGWVTSTYLWLVDGDEFLGEVNIRHDVNESLLLCGGHIGYGVRCSRWNQGIGSEMLRLALEYAREKLLLKEVLITCNDDNFGSARVIENNGGVLRDKIENIKNGKKVLTRRYWIEVKN